MTGSSREVTTDFRVNVRDWVAYDDKILKAGNAIKRVREKQNQLGFNIINFMDSNNLQKKEIKINNCRLQYRTSTKTTPLTKKYVQQALVEYLDNEEEAKEMVKTLYNVRKRMEICFTDYFEDEYKAKEAVNFIYNNRKQEEIIKIRRKVQREPVTIDGGPISQSAQNALQTPENTEDED